MLNKSGPNIEPRGTLEVYLPNYCMMTLFWLFVFDFDDNSASFLKQLKADRKHSILLQVNHDICNQMLSLSQ